MSTPAFGGIGPHAALLYFPFLLRSRRLQLRPLLE